MPSFGEGVCDDAALSMCNLGARYEAVDGFAMLDNAWGEYCKFVHMMCICYASGREVHCTA